jgi:hypothetical protein
MNRKSGFFAFLTALIPGVGYLYLGLKRKGIEAFLLFILISPLLDAVGLQSLEVIKYALWFYTFFDTINLAKRIDNGEFIPDTDFLFFNKINENINSSFKNDYNSVTSYNNKNLYIAGWALIVLGCLAIFNKLLRGSFLYSQLRHMFSIYLIPFLLVGAGIYILIKNRK